MLRVAYMPAPCDDAARSQAATAAHVGALDPRRHSLGGGSGRRGGKWVAPNTRESLHYISSRHPAGRTTSREHDKPGDIIRLHWGIANGEEERPIGGAITAARQR